MIRVDLHRHGEEPLDITSRVESLSVRNAVTAPWGSISVQLVVPNNHPWFGGIRRGDWLVVTDPRVGALGWGIIPDLQHTDSADGLGIIDNASRSLRAISWLDYLGMVDVAFAYERRGRSVGTMFNVRDWSRVVVRSRQRITGQIGPIVESLVDSLALLRLPSSMGGKLIGEDVRVIFNEDTARAFGPDISVDPVVGPSIGGLQTTMTGPGRALALLLAAVGGDQHMVELFPTLSSPGTFERTKHVEYVTEDQLDPFGALRRSLVAKVGNNRAQPMKFRVESQATRRQRPAASGVLGGTPSLVYRMPPWRTQALEPWVSDVGAKLGASSGWMTGETAERFSAVTWPSKRHFVLPADRVLRVGRRENIQNDYNAITIGLPNAPDQPRWVEEWGLPIHAPFAIDRYGLRLLNVEWPFFVPGDREFTSHMRAVAWQAAQWYLGHGRFTAGTVEALYDPWCRPGESFRAGFGPDRDLEAYADAVTHSFASEGDAVVRTTSIEYSRGLTESTGNTSGRREQPYASFPSIE